MDIDTIMALVKAKTNERSSDAGQMTLGALLDALRLITPETPVRYDFGAYPAEADSFRGYYEQLGFAISDKPTTVGAFLKIAQEACGETFMGYKGGDYVMSRGTWIWAANYGTSVGARRIVGITATDGEIVLLTSEDDE